MNLERKADSVEDFQRHTVSRYVAAKPKTYLCAGRGKGPADDSEGTLIERPVVGLLLTTGDGDGGDEDEAYGRPDAATRSISEVEYAAYAPEAGGKPPHWGARCDILSFMHQVRR